MKKIKVLMGIVLGIAVLGACKKDPETTSYSYNVRMTDAPGPYDAVFIDLQGVEITGKEGKTVVLNVKKGIYNLLNFANGLDTLIATGTTFDANVEQIRLILGTNNSVFIDSVSYPLSTPSADQSGLKLQVHQTLTAGVLYTVLLDFDANQSIVYTGNNTYKLKPVIRTVETAISGSISGKITPVGTAAVITASNGTNYSTNVSSAGYFLLMGIPAGTYTITITPDLPKSPVTINNVIVTTGINTNLSIINL